MYELVTLYNNQIDRLLCKSRESIVVKILPSTIQYAIHKSMNMMILMINRSKSILVFHLEGIELERLANGVGCERLRGKVAYVVYGCLFFGTQKSGY